MTNARNAPQVAKLNASAHSHRQSHWQVHFNIYKTTLSLCFFPLSVFLYLSLPPFLSLSLSLFFSLSSLLCVFPLPHLPLRMARLCARGQRREGEEEKRGRGGGEEEELCVLAQVCSLVTHSHSALHFLFPDTCQVRKQSDRPRPTSAKSTNNHSG